MVCGRCFAAIFALYVGPAVVGADECADAARTTAADPIARWVDAFSDDDDSTVINAIANERALDWIVANVPQFECPSQQFNETYYFRWWSYRKHLKQTPHGGVVTEFLTPVGHAGPYNTISCAFGHHVAEGRWLRDQGFLDEYARYWFRGGEQGGPARHFHKYSSWAAAALYDRYLTTGESALLVELLDDFIADYAAWKVERQSPSGLFWQFDVRDGMEESISGSRTEKHLRPTINCYMAANAAAISRIARLADRKADAERFAAEADQLVALIRAELWDPKAEFFKVKLASDELSDVREAIGFLPWTFDVAGPEHAAAWRQIRDPQGFAGLHGLTTAERRHPAYCSHGTGTCEWDGAVWPFATSQTLTGLARLLHGSTAADVSSQDFFDQMMRYARAHQRDGKPYLGEYHDADSGAWLITGPKEVRSRYYNHSTFADLVIFGLVGLIPAEGDRLTVHPLVPASAWDWFCLKSVPYHGRKISVVWDRHGDHYNCGQGLSLWCNGAMIAHAPTLQRLEAALCPPEE